MTYFNSSEDPSDDLRTISYQVDDGAATDHASNIATAIVSVTPVNDALTGETASDTFDYSAPLAQTDITDFIL